MKSDEDTGDPLPTDTPILTERVFRLVAASGAGAAEEEEPAAKQLARSGLALVLVARATLKTL